MRKFLLGLFLLCTTSVMWGQESQQEKLEKRKAEIQQEILDNEKLLQTVKKKEKSAVNVIILQSNKIKLKEKLIRTTEKQTKILSNDMYINQMKINKLNRELAILKEDYAKMIVKSYKSRSEQSRAMFLLSSENFLQAYKRAQYMKQYTSYRKMQGEEIKSKTNELLGYNERLNIQKAAKKKLLVENTKEKLSLEKEKREQLKLVNSIKKDKKKITAEIKRKQQESRAIDRQIDRLIREAIAAANRKAASENPNAPVAAYTSSKIVLTAESKILADNFRANRGKLPWPVEKGFVSLPFGDQPHPVYPSLVIHNSGVEITTEQGANARAVFGGEVTSVIVLSPVNKAVMIQHGDCFTVYQNLSSVFVSKGEKVNIKQSLGKIRTNSEGKTILKFTISQNTTYNNPASWLYNM
ncbi:septal ring factor EnvC (AmiA/AmiB activator) [Flavobacterium sp. 103]|uniref:murein hydrolase activator EnvC family protein n=1 Tax=unclassified Flavobacterium TaxID=196869 RepID=UPI000D5FC93E|nr:MULTISPECIES: peptidoglycan DD-metalloendopeptidase family protein [unclassified Flavobacterium]PVX45932.1 septal ring factor EnvC (AmiA/AmiB activator) [Flavobacterium sp. 103]QKJ61934.1 peptidoglycan DD-metalloendopeptidase family protein [Flavobacterium sp. M31R6]